jgi:hypothetical protein
MKIPPTRLHFLLLLLFSLSIFELVTIKLMHNYPSFIKSVDMIKTVGVKNCATLKCTTTKEKQPLLGKGEKSQIRSDRERKK